MSLADRLKHARTQPRTFDTWVNELNPTDREALITAAADQAISHRALFDAVKAEGARVSRETVVTWRKTHGFPR